MFENRVIERTITTNSKRGSTRRPEELNNESFITCTPLNIMVNHPRRMRWADM
jgi:hypothetical protein